MQQNPSHEIKLSLKQAFLQVVGPVYLALFTLCNTCHGLCYHLYIFTLPPPTQHATTVDRTIAAADLRSANQYVQLTDVIHHHQSVVHGKNDKL